jgi:hypothetical protein
MLGEILASLTQDEEDRSVGPCFCVAAELAEGTVSVGRATDVALDLNDDTSIDRQIESSTGPLDLRLLALDPHFRRPPAEVN